MQLDVRLELWDIYAHLQSFDLRTRLHAQKGELSSLNLEYTPNTTTSPFVTQQVKLSLGVHTESNKTLRRSRSRFIIPSTTMFPTLSS